MEPIIAHSTGLADLADVYTVDAANVEESDGKSFALQYEASSKAFSLHPIGGDGVELLTDLKDVTKERLGCNIDGHKIVFRYDFPKRKYILEPLIELSDTEVGVHI